MNVRLQRAVREYELDQIAPLMPNGSHILEIGAGAGWQAKKLTEKGFDVTAIDLKDRSLAQHAVWGIEHYDGKIIPFPDHHFDVVFTSNVLDHIPHVVEFQVEIKRVLKAEGMAIHVLPTTAWRFWTIVTHYPHYVTQLVLLIAGNLLRKGPRKGGGRVQLHTNGMRDHIKGFISTILFVPRLGERGNHLTELFLFSHRHRMKFFVETGWLVQAWHPNKLFYSGQKLFGSMLSLKSRCFLSQMLGSSGRIYVVKNAAIPGSSCETDPQCGEDEAPQGADGWDRASSHCGGSPRTGISACRG